MGSLIRQVICPDSEDIKSCIIFGDEDYEIDNLDQIIF